MIKKLIVLPIDLYSKHIPKMSNNFDKYCSRLGYSNSMANDAKKKLGNKASTSELLAVVLSNAKNNNVQPNRSSQPSYLQRQVRLLINNLFAIFQICWINASFHCFKNCILWFNNFQRFIHLITAISISNNGNDFHSSCYAVPILVSVKNCTLEFDYPHQNYFCKFPVH